MHSHKNQTPNLASLHLMPSGDDQLRDAFAAIAEPCDRQPDVFFQVRHGVRAPWRVMFRYFADAFNAASTPQARRQVVERVVSFLDEGVAYVRCWILNGAPIDRRDVFETAQQSDGDEDMAECLYLMNPCDANASRLIEAGRLERSRSEVRETYLLRQMSPRNPQGAA